MSQHLRIPETSCVANGGQSSRDNRKPPPARLTIGSEYHLSAVDMDRLRRNITGVGAAEKPNRSCDFLRLAAAGHGDERIPGPR